MHLRFSLGVLEKTTRNNYTFYPIAYYTLRQNIICSKIKSISKKAWFKLWFWILKSNIVKIENWILIRNIEFCRSVRDSLRIFQLIWSFVCQLCTTLSRLVLIPIFDFLFLLCLGGDSSQGMDFRPKMVSKTSTNWMARWTCPQLNSSHFS